MNRPLHRLALIAAALCLHAIGEAKKPPSGIGQSACSPGRGRCDIAVIVDRCNEAGGIRVVPELVSVDRRSKMHWTITTPGFVFAADGIAFDPPHPQFMKEQSSAANEFRIDNKKTHKLPDRDDAYKYFVKVQGCEVVDPWVRNR